MIKFLRGIYYRIYIIRLSARWIFPVNLGDTVIYNNNEYLVSNGVRFESWKLYGLRNESDGWVKRAECIKVKRLSNYANSFLSGYRFYMTSWYSIWVNKGIEPWMRGCDIWKS